MALETREEFLAEWMKVSATLLGDEAPGEDVARAGDLMYDARVVAYAAAAEEGLNVTAHQYFHGTSLVILNFMTQLPIPNEVLPFLTGEYMFHQGFAAGMFYARRDPKDDSTLGMVDEQEAIDCLGEQDNMNRTREEIEARLMPSPIEGIQVAKAMVERMAEAAEKAEPATEGAPIVPPDEGEGYVS